MSRSLVFVFLVLLVCSEVQGQIFFQENDFSADGNVTQIRVVKNGGNAGPIQVTILPMTVGEYLQSGGGDCNLPSSFDPAESGDFDNTPLQQTFLPSSQSETLIFNVPLPQDVVVEATEIFVIVMNVTGGEGFTITRGCTYVRITETFTGEFFQWSREGQVITNSISLIFSEKDGRQLLVTANRLVPAEIETEIITPVIPGAGTNFILNRTFIIPPDRSSVDIVLDIIDDNKAERDNPVTFDLVARASGALSPAHLSVTVTILDDEVVNYVFVNTPPVINVTEGKAATVFTMLNPILDVTARPELALLQTENGSALEGIDFMRQIQQYPLLPVPLPTVITTILRPRVQPTRSFTVRLLPSNPSTLHRLTNINGTVTINILDDPSSNTVIQWQSNGGPVNSPLSLDLQESSGSQVLLTVNRTVPLSQPITITATVSGTATGNSDFILNRTYELPPDRSSVDVLLDIIDDDLAELDETITISLRAEVPGLNLTDRERTLEVVVNILDNEVLNYVFLNALPVIKITEGESVILMTGLNPIIHVEGRGPLVARIRSRSGTAREGTDFIKIDSQINALSTQSSHTITTISRPGIQPDRSFTLHLSPDSASISHHLTNISGSIVINILDNSMQPLAPSVSKFGFDKDDQLVVEWDHESSGSRPLDHFTVIVKSCDKRPCLIDTDNPQSDEKATMSPKDRREFFYKPDLKYMVFSVLVCAENSLGRNCTAYDPVINTVIVTPGLVEDPNDPFLIWLVVICVLLVLLCCCCIPIIILILCCCYKRDKERAYYPKRNMGRMLKGASPGSSDSNSEDIYVDEMKYSDMKYL